MSSLYFPESEKGKEREKIEFMMKGYSASNELRERVASAMAQRREENERKKALRAKAARNVVMRVAAVAAMITLIVTVTPLRGYVANAADSFNSFNAWTEDVFEVGMKKTKKDCTIEITEASVANDFLYLTVNESCKGKEDWDFDVRYSGTISQGLFNKLNFDTDNMIGTGRGSILQRAPAYDGDANNLVKIYIPELKNFIVDSDEEYKCKLTADFTDNDGKSLAKIKFNFDLGNVDGVLSSNEIPLDYTTKVENLEFSFEKIEVSNNGTSELFVQLIPQCGLKINENLSIYIGLDLCNLKDLHNDYMQDETAREVCDDCEYKFVQGITKSARNIYTIDSKYYMVISLNKVKDKEFDKFEPDYLTYDSLSDPDVNIYLTGLLYDIYYPDIHKLSTKNSLKIERAGSMDLKMINLENRCYEISDVYVGEYEEKNELTIRGKKFVFDYFLGRSGKLMMLGSGKPNDISTVFCNVESARVAAVKDGEIVFTASINENRRIVSTDIHYWTTGPQGDITFYNSKGIEMSCDFAYRQEYDHIVVTNLNFLSYDDDGKIRYYDSYYNPKYYSASQCEKDYEAKCEQLASLLIK